LVILNNNIKFYFFWACGIIGACIVLAGFTHTPAQAYYVTGSILLLLTAIYFKLTYFIALEMILLAGHGAILFGIGPTLQFVLPILLCVQLLVYYLISGELKSIFTLVGIAGISLLSIGFSFAKIWVFFLGSFAIAIFAFYNVYKGKKIALIWGILNLIFASVTGYLLFTNWTIYG